MEEKYGFVYIWRDKKHKRYYIGSHWGHENDGYICSSTWMMNSYRKRPNDFNRRILTRTNARSELLNEESNWLSRIRKDKIEFKKYYNLHNHKCGHWATKEISRKKVSQKISESPLRRESISKAMKGKIPSEANKIARLKACAGRKQTEEEKQKRAASCRGLKRSDEFKQKMKNRIIPELQCPHCFFEGAGSAMYRWHFNNCKSRGDVIAS